MLECVDFVSTTRLEAMTGDPRWSVISITDPGTSLARIPSAFGEALRLSFDDLDYEHVQRGSVGTQIGPRELLKLLSWLEERHSDPRTQGIVVQCEAGRSRSAAIAIFISGLYGAQFVERRRVDGFNGLLLSLIETVTRHQVGRPAQWVVMPGDVISPGM